MTETPQTTPRRTPLYDFHARHGARFVDFAGWEMPVQYSGIMSEHKAVREAAGLFDVSHMGEARMRGRQAADFLDHLLTNRIGRAAVGKAVYSPMCYDDGGCVDDLIVYRTGGEAFLAVLNASNARKDLDWMQEQARSFAVEVADACGDYAQLALQGPRALEIAAPLVEGGLEGLERFTCREGTIAGVPALIAWTGYTGEAGLEIYCGPERAEEIAQALLEAGAGRGLLLCGLGARDSLRLEAGMPLYGHEIAAGISPVEAGLGWAVKTGKEAFIGRDVLARQKEEGAPRKLVWFKLGDRRIARQGAEVFAHGEGGEPVGEVRSGTQSPTLGCPIGSALVAAAAEPGQLFVEVRGRRIKMVPVEPPFHPKRTQ